MSRPPSRWTGSVPPAARGAGWLAALSLHHAALFYEFPFGVQGSAAVLVSGQEPLLC